MFQQFYEPHPALKAFVNNIMIHYVKFGEGQPQLKFSVPPLPENCLFFYIRDHVGAENMTTNKKETHSSSIVLGPHFNRHVITHGRNHLMVKVGFKPGGLYRFLGIPMNELLCKDAFDSADLLGSEMKEVDDKLKHAVSFIEMKMIIERFLLKKKDKLKPSLPIDQVLDLLIKEGGLVKIDELAFQACMSIRQFERVFQQRIGLPPKHFSRMVRFAKAWIMKEQQPVTPWTKIAYECGYTDHSAFSRQFKAYAGMSPTEYGSRVRQGSHAAG